MKLSDKRSLFLAVIWLIVGIAGIACVFLRASRPLYYKITLSVLSVVMIAFSADSFRHAFFAPRSGKDDLKK